DLFAEKRGRIDAVRTDLNFPAAVTRDHLKRVDGVLEFRGIAGDSQKPQRHWNDIVRKRRHFIHVFKAELAAFPQRRVNQPDSQLRQFVDLDGLAIVGADVVEPRKFFHHAIDESSAVVVQATRAGFHEIVETAVVFLCQHRAYLSPDLHLFVQHGHFDVASEYVFELRTSYLGEKFAIENWNPIVHSPFHTTE